MGAPARQAGSTTNCRRCPNEAKVNDRELAEQSENVYENKGPARNSTTPGPSLSKRGELQTPLLERGGVEGGATLRPWRSLRLGVKPGLLARKIGEQSENVYENKGWPADIAP
jgi:hypothetical protein